MTFGDALRELKAGARVRRAGWNGKGMWIALTPGSTFPVEAARAGAAAKLALKERAVLAPDPPPIVVNPHIDMRAADGSLVIGWLASQTDMLAEDWELVE